MRDIQLAAALLACIAYGCNGGNPQLPVAPSAVPSTPPLSSVEPRLSPPSQRSHQPDLGTAIILEQIVNSRVTADDQICGDRYRYPCKHFRLQLPQDGVLEVTIRWSAAQPNPYPLDMDVIGPSGAGWLGEIANGPYRIARGRASAGSTYVIEVWSFLTPGEPFELTASLQHR